jgi:hypothetical protein
MSPKSPIFVLFSHLLLDLVGGLFLHVFPPKRMHLATHIVATCLTRLSPHYSGNLLGDKIREIRGYLQKEPSNFPCRLTSKPLKPTSPEHSEVFRIEEHLKKFSCLMLILGISPLPRQIGFSLEFQAVG